MHIPVIVGCPPLRLLLDYHVQLPPFQMRSRVTAHLAVLLRVVLESLHFVCEGGEDKTDHR